MGLGRCWSDLFGLCRIQLGFVGFSWDWSDSVGIGRIQSDSGGIQSDLVGIGRILIFAKFSQFGWTPIQLGLGQIGSDSVELARIGLESVKNSIIKKVRTIQVLVLYTIYTIYTLRHINTYHTQKQ